jgi:hypothetical protein
MAQKRLDSTRRMPDHCSKANEGAVTKASIPDRHEWPMSTEESMNYSLGARTLAVLFCFTVVGLLNVQLAHGINVVTTNCCYGHQYTYGGNGYPFVENIEDRLNYRKRVDHASTVLNTECPPLSGESASTTRKEVRIAPGTGTKLLVRGYIRIDCVAGISPGARFNLTLHVNGQQISGATKFIAMRDGSTTAASLPQTHLINGVAEILGDVGNDPGLHMLEMKAQMVDGGEFTTGLTWLTATGVPASAPSGKHVSGQSISVGTSWTQVSSTGSFSSANALDLMTQGYLQFVGGTPGHRIEVEFRRRSPGGAWLTAPRTSVLGVPCPLKDLNNQCVWFAPDPARDGANVFDHQFDVPSGSWEVAMFARNIDGGTTSFGWRQLEYVGIPVAVGVKKDVYHTNTIIVDAQGSPDQPEFATLFNTACGSWTKAMSIDMPPTDITSNWIGHGYIEFVGRGDGTAGSEGDWTNEVLQVILEPTHQRTEQCAPVPSELGMLDFDVSSNPKGLYFPISAAAWGNAESTPGCVDPKPGVGNTLTVWIRKKRSVPGQSQCYLETCAWTAAAEGHAKFRIGKRYVAAKLVPSDSHINKCLN